MNLCICLVGLNHHEPSTNGPCSSMFESYKINTWLVVFTTILKNITPYFALLGSKGAADATLLAQQFERTTWPLPG